jgi:hypothetical protein
LLSMDHRESKTMPTVQKVFSGASTAYIRAHFTGTVQRYEVLQGLKKQYGLSQTELRFVLHLLECVHEQLVDHAWLGPENVAIPIPRNAIHHSVSALRFETLLGAQILFRDYYSPERHRCYAYSIAPDIYQIYHQSFLSRTGEEILADTYVDLLTGKVRTRQFHDPHGSELLRAALTVLRWNVVHVEALVQEYTHGLGDARAVQYVHTNTLSLETLALQGLRVSGKFVRYHLAYHIGSTGRLYEKGRGMQGITRALKRAGYMEVPCVVNYDLRSSQIAALIVLGKEFGLDTTWFEAYVQDRHAKNFYAWKLGMEVECWKVCLLALLFGSNLHYKAGAVREVLARDMEFRHASPAEIEVVLQKMAIVCAPLLSVIETWYRMLGTTVLAQRIQTSPRVPGKYICNAAGARFAIVEGPLAHSTLSQLNAFLLQGLEASFIHWVTKLSVHYEYVVRSNEHDGVVSQGRIPDAAIQEARVRSGFHTAILEEKAFS